MSDRYSVKDAAAIFGLSESRLRYWAQTGLLSPSIRAGGRRYYTFRDLVQIRAAKDLLDAGTSVYKVRKNLDALRAVLPQADYPASTMRIVSDGETVVARDPDDVLFEPLTGQLVMDFSLDALGDQIADILALPTSLRSAEIATLAPESSPSELDGPEPPPMPPIADLLVLEPIVELYPGVGQTTEYRPVGDRAISAYPLTAPVANDQVPVFPVSAAEPDEAVSTIDELAISVAEELSQAEPEPDCGARDSAYETFMRGCDADDQGDLATAEVCYRQALELQPTLSSAHTNLGILRYRQGDLAGARAAFERALELEPAQPEARYNLSAICAESGDLERAVSHLQRVLWTHPRFADGHYNLARLLVQRGAFDQAREHLERFLSLHDDEYPDDTADDDWLGQARALLTALG